MSFEKYGALSSQVAFAYKPSGYSFATNEPITVGRLGKATADINDMRKILVRLYLGKMSNVCRHRKHSYPSY